jgi:hypothetical protein
VRPARSSSRSRTSFHRRNRASASSSSPLIVGAPSVGYLR